MKKYLCEFIGTFISVFIGCGVAVVTHNSVIASSLAFGLILIALSYWITPISGCHINPAVSLANFFVKKINGKDFIIYVIMQILGSFGGIILLGYLLNDFAHLAANSFGTEGLLATNATSAFIIEMFLTFIFILTTLGVNSQKKMLIFLASY